MPTVVFKHGSELANIKRPRHQSSWRLWHRGIELSNVVDSAKTNQSTVKRNLKWNLAVAMTPPWVNCLASWAWQCQIQEHRPHRRIRLRADIDTAGSLTLCFLFLERIRINLIMSRLFNVYGVHNKENKGYFSMLNNSYSETSLITKVS